MYGGGYLRLNFDFVLRKTDFLLSNPDFVLSKTDFVEPVPITNQDRRQLGSDQA